MSAPHLSPQHAEFDEYARRWLDENAPPPPPERLPLSPIEVMTVGQRDYLQDWQGRCYEAGLIGCDYPVEYGGRGQQGFQSIANQALGKARVPFMIKRGRAQHGPPPRFFITAPRKQKNKVHPGCSQWFGDLVPGFQ